MLLIMNPFSHYFLAQHPDSFRNLNENKKTLPPGLFEGGKKEEAGERKKSDERGEGITEMGRERRGGGNTAWSGGGAAGRDTVGIGWGGQREVGLEGFSTMMHIFGGKKMEKGREKGGGSRDQTVRLWDVESGKELKKYEGNSTSVSSVAFSPDGKKVVSGSHDQTVRLWDVDSGKEFKKYEGHSDSVCSVAFHLRNLDLLGGINYFNVQIPEHTHDIFNLIGRNVRRENIINLVIG